jgi:hypothetical protein
MIFLTSSPLTYTAGSAIGFDGGAAGSFSVRFQQHGEALGGRPGCPTVMNKPCCHDSEEEIVRPRWLILKVFVFPASVPHALSRSKPYAE